MNPDSMSGCVYKNGLPEVVAMIFSVSISFVDTVLAPGDFKKNHEKKGATFAQGDQAQAILRKSKPPRKSPAKWTFLSLAFYNAPSLHTVNYHF